MPISMLLESIVAWVRKGYPEGVPRQDYIPLLALLKRRMNDDELAQVAHELATSGEDDEKTIASAIEALTHEEPSAADIERVRERLRETGWDPAGNAATVR
jgi:alkylhydroperoxidase family enzyme